MQAVMYDHFGDESVLSVRETAVPKPGPGQVLVRVRVASLNPVDFKLRDGLFRMMGRPKRPTITGTDFAGEITVLGPNTQGYSIGQRVFGSVDLMGEQGSCAQFVALSTDRIAATPDPLSDEVAACLPVASGTALQALTDIAHLQSRQSVLITGASGAVGASAVQIAHSIGAHITGVCGTANVDYVRSIGADVVIDYKTDSWHQRDAQFDVIFDAAAAASFTVARRRLANIGVYINTTPGPALYWASLLAKLGSRQRCVPFMLKTDAVLLQRLAKLAADGVIVPHVHEIIDLSQVASAQHRMQRGQIHGKVCV